MILEPVSRLMQQQHASSRVQCDILEPPAPAPESALSGIVSLMMAQSILESEGYFPLLVQCDIFCPLGDVRHRVTGSQSGVTREMSVTTEHQLLTLCGAVYSEERSTVGYV